MDTVITGALRSSCQGSTSRTCTQSCWSSGGPTSTPRYQRFAMPAGGVTALRQGTFKCLHSSPPSPLPLLSWQTPCLPLTALLRHVGLTHFNLWVLDVEGAEFQVFLRLCPLCRAWRVGLSVWEQSRGVWLSAVTYSRCKLCSSTSIGRKDCTLQPEQTTSISRHGRGYNSKLRG